MKLALAQINPTVGALDANRQRILDAVDRAARAGATLVAVPELALSGYPPEDLILKHHFLEDVDRHLVRLAEALPPGMTLILGAPVREGGAARNAAVVLRRGAPRAVYAKMLLPNYGVFDEKRLFEPGTRGVVVEAGGCRIGLHVCEDSWRTDSPAFEAYDGAGLDLLLNLSASPYHRGKLRERENILREATRRAGAPVAYVNLVGGQDELVFDGASLVLDRDGSLLQRAQSCGEDLLVLDLPAPPPAGRGPIPETCQTVPIAMPSPVETGPTVPRIEPAPDPVGEVYAALRLGVRDYVDKNGFSGVLIAISGGIDSALVAALAVDALGPDRVRGITLPSRFSSSGTHDDAHELARRLGFALDDLAIQPLQDAFLAALNPLWPGREPDVTEENLQARIRGTAVMALSNKLGLLVLTTGNKSELATGYCTLYGDMVGGFAAIKDVPKTLVFELSRWRNRQAEEPVIPESILTRPPSAELREDQKDTDSLPPYDILDPILERYVERDWSAERIVGDGFDPDTVERVLRLVDLNEYKRRQGAPGIKITPKAFGRDRRLPITNHYRESAPRPAGPEGKTPS